MELVYIEAEPGDALFFHSNLLHRSDQNRSPRSRWSLICCYNAARNDPYKESRHPRYEPLVKVADTAIKDWAARANVREGAGLATAASAKCGLIKSAARLRSRSKTTWSARCAPTRSLLRPEAREIRRPCAPSRRP